jgi:hypothetical protein
MDQTIQILMPGSLRFWLDATVFAAVFTFFAPIIWKVVGRLTDHIVLSLTLRTRKAVFNLSSVHNVPDEIRNCKYILIRYGTDQYLANLASDSERHQGRLRNKVYDVKTIRHGSSVQLFLKLRVHKRLGTQFKMFVECTGDTEPVMKFLKSQEMITCPKLETYSGVNRIYFLSKRFPVVKSIEGTFCNNMVFPQ